jgi:hypothetical protein
MSKPIIGFIMLPRALVRGETWRQLSPGAVVILIDMWSLHNGVNNGAIRYGIRQAMAANKCSRSTAIRKLHELEAAEMIEAVERGGFRWKTGAREGRATTWRIIPQQTRSKGANP